MHINAHKFDFRRFDPIVYYFFHEIINYFTLDIRKCTITLEPREVRRRKKILSTEHNRRRKRVTPVVQVYIIIYRIQRGLT